MGDDVDRAHLDSLLDDLFTGEGRGGLPDTRAVLVVRGGRLVLERYAPGFDANQRFHSWSMAKSVTQGLIGILVREGRLAVDERAPVDAWSAQGDPRRALTLRHLLHMTSGLANADGEDGAGPESFVATLLFGSASHDMAGSAAAVPLAHDPGTHWAYSTGTSAILGGIVSQTVGDRAAVRAWLERELLTPLGMDSLVLEVDTRGQLVGGSHAWATARDWARFGLLYLRGGVWDGQTILPGGWVDFSRTPAPAPNNTTFGAHLWINHDPASDQFKPIQGAGPSVFTMSGNGGQYVAMVPEKDLVVVRLGEMLVHDWDALSPKVGALIQAFPDRAPGEAAP